MYPYLLNYWVFTYACSTFFFICLRLMRGESRWVATVSASAPTADRVRLLREPRGDLLEARVGEVVAAVELLEGACNLFERNFGSSHVKVETTTSALLELSSALSEDRSQTNA